MYSSLKYADAHCIKDIPFSLLPQAFFGRCASVALSFVRVILLKTNLIAIINNLALYIFKSIAIYNLLLSVFLIMRSNNVKRVN